ncbi:MAG: hypothetical protein COA52_12475 [Hyphomicrobiales bacterium]|nr:MAG: hypothetical protein COA52_12475 [Hyphomicrobiales bacterium]
MTSTLVIHDIASARDTIVLETEKLIEAPNWAPDGSYLLVNGEGVLFRVDHEGARTLEQVDSGFASTCNNDHGISPDGSTIVISDGTKSGRSRIYTLPVGGGAPKAIVDEDNSYWHGWSPDGDTLAYCAARNGIFDIYSISLSGGDEKRLTDGKGHSDGPDYSPDGTWIWFNSSRSGIMQIWRMRTDGSDLQQMTNDPNSNWFPHPSPDGKTVLYLAYEAGVDGHPRDHDVELKLMDPDGSNARSILAFFGGQGSINVPCWSPDSTKFAYMRYSKD